jgi:ABC-type nitrate/sulfonate/bicarbonate transport system permease component/ABC-type nitrate/sulfonate/bicarbonate transport system substrate-binding protein
VSLAVLGALWLFISEGGIVPSYMLPSPLAVVDAFVTDLALLMSHAAVTLQEAVYGLLIGTALGFIIAVLMDRFDFLYKALYPILIITQTIPTIAIAPLLVLWMGFSMAPKITLVVLTTFFPVTISLLDGFKSVDADSINLIRSMGGGNLKIFRHIKLPGATEQFFSGLKVSASYSVVGAVISEWLGGFEGLGVYMTRVKKAYAFDKMFAVIIFVSLVSLALMGLVNVLKNIAMPYKRRQRERKISMKKIIAIMLSLVLLFGLCACLNSADEESDIKEITLCLDWTPNTNHTGFYVADKLGYYEEAGIKVTIVQPPEGGAEAMTAAGQAQFGISAQDSLAANFASDEPMKITAVATILQHNTSGIISRDAKTPKDLEGKRYSTWDSPTEKAIIRYVMEKDGGDFSKVELIPNVITNEAEALKHGDTDAVWIYYAWSGINAELSGLDFEYFDFREIDEVFDFYTPVIIANDSFLESDPDTAVAFLSATAKGYEYAIENPEEAAQILIDGDETGSLLGSEELVIESQKWIGQQYKADVDRWGFINPERWNAFYNWLGAEGLTESIIPDNTGFANDYLL